MRLFLAVAVLCAYRALAQYEYDEDDSDEIEARDVRDSVWQAAHGGSKGSTYRGFEEMAQGYPGHPLKAYGTQHHHPRDVGDESGLGDEDGFIDSAASFANNFARAVKDKANEAVKHAKAKAGYDDEDNDWRHLQWGPHGVGQHHGAGKWPQGQHSAGYGHGEPWKVSKRDVEDDYDDDVVEDATDGEFDDDSGLVERDVAAEIDWDPSTRYDNGPQLAERDPKDDESAAPVDAAFDHDDEDLPDPKLQMEEEFDRGLVERGEDGIYERDAEAEPFTFFGWAGKHDEHKGAGHDEHDAWKKGMKQIYARDGGVVPENDDDLEDAYDPAAEDPNTSDKEFYKRAYDGDLDLGLDERSAPHIVHDNWGPA